MNEELREILVKFASSGWDLIDSVSEQYLSKDNNKSQLISAIEQANEQCGTCGCEYDPLYKRALELLQA